MNPAHTPILLAVAERQEDAIGAQEPCGVVELRDQLIGKQRLLLHNCDARCEVRVLLEAFLVLHGADMPVASEIQVDEIWVVLLHRFHREARAPQHSNGQAVDEHVSRQQKVPDPLCAVLSGDVGLQRELPTVRRFVETGPPRPLPCDDLDHLCSMLGQRPAHHWRGDDVGELYDDDIRQGRRATAREPARGAGSLHMIEDEHRQLLDEPPLL
mmetsp:Transcript_31792/g.87831  ORF Transcript_31792/g.87831 Transcript_31792/m.87831 type:complete len:213 (+) Transcript_31792:1556-2194(+)